MRNSKNQTFVNKIDLTIRKGPNYFSQSLFLFLCDSNCLNALFSRDWTGLRSLSLWQCEFDDDKIKVVAKLSWWVNLQVFEIDNDGMENKITGVGLNQLLKRKLPKLMQLKLRYNWIGNKGLALMALSQNLPQLRKLDVSFNEITHLGIKWFLRVNKFSQLRYLNLGFNNIGSEGVKWLVKIELPLLQQLNLDQCRIGSEGLKSLSKGDWKYLNSLDVSLNEDGFCKGDSFFVTHSNWKEMQTFYVDSFYDIDVIEFLGLVGTNWKPTATIMHSGDQGRLFQATLKVLSNRLIV